MMLLALMVCQTPASASTETLPFDARVAAQEAIERVYHDYRLGDKPPFEEYVPRPLLEEKVRTYLRQSVLLERRYHLTIDAAMLQRELERVAARTQFPDRLRRIESALGGDPLLLLECFARPLLVDRLSRSFYSQDRTVHREAWARAEETRDRLRSGELDPGVPEARRIVLEVERKRADPAGRPIRDESGRGRLVLTPEAFDRVRRLVPDRVGVPAPVTEDRDALVIRVLLDEADGRARIAAYRFPKVDWESWWPEESAGLDETRVRPVVLGPQGRYGLPEELQAESSTCAPDAWDGGLTLGGTPDAGTGPSAVWTGSEMIVWGRPYGSPEGTRYDPLTDTWTPTTTRDAPSGRDWNGFVWTGDRMIVWGGSDGEQDLGDGAAYDPVQDRWTPIASAGAPSPRTHVSAVWTGEEMIIWGGATTDPYVQPLPDGGRYDPASDTWAPLSLDGAPGANMDHVMLWTGSEVLLWGGGFGSTAARYDPQTDTWSSMSVDGAPSFSRTDYSAVWTGTEMILWGGVESYAWQNTGYRYNPATDTWAPTSTTGAPQPRARHVAVWTGTEMIIAGGSVASPEDVGGRYDPATDTWAPVSEVNAPPRSRSASAVWTGELMVIWGGVDSINYIRINTGGRYDPATDTWTPTSVGSAPAARSDHTAVWTGAEMIVWGGEGESLTVQNRRADGGVYDPLTDQWRPTRVSNAPSARSLHSAVWTGSRMVIWGGQTESYGPGLNTGGRYSPVADNWTATAIPAGELGRYGHSAVWTGSRMIVWGGRGDGAYFDTGGAYDPVLNVWSPITSAGAPSPRWGNSSVWTGNEMIIWGGAFSNPLVQPLSDGARYDPASDSWSPVAAAGAPTPRYARTATWTGSEMVVWGDSSDNTGAVYDPATDTWAATSQVGAPAARYDHTAILALGRVVVWGGSSGSQYWSDGGLYDPATDTWSPMTTLDGPSGRAEHTAVFTGQSMLVWGGANPYWTATGGAYLIGTFDDTDGDGFTVCEGDCDDRDPGRHAGLAEICDGVDNDCDRIVPADEVDADGDGYLACAECDDDDPLEYPGNPEVCDNHDNDCDGVVDGFFTYCGVGGCAASGTCTGGVDSCSPGTPVPEACDGQDNDCDGSLPADEEDPDGDGAITCRDCDPQDEYTFPGAPETHDGKDNQCPGDAGYGLLDEVSGLSGFTVPTQYCWPGQAGAGRYDVIRSPYPDFATGCAWVSATETCRNDPATPASGEAFYYLVRADDLYVGSWGAGRDDVERSPACDGEACGDGFDNDGDGRVDCDDPECLGQATCSAVTFTFTDSAGDDVTPDSLADFFSQLSLTSTDYIAFRIDSDVPDAFEWCAAGADKYRAEYLALAPTGGTSPSGSTLWYRTGTGSWTGPVTSPWSNAYGDVCVGSQSWCSEAGLGGRILTVAPADTAACEARDLIYGCGTGSWPLTISVGIDRPSACGF